MQRLITTIKLHPLRFCLVLVFMAASWVQLNQEKWKSTSVFAFDVGQYYSYLPATFCEHDLRLTFLSSEAYPLKGYYAVNHSNTGAPVIKMTMGLALFELPFFLLAHSYAQVFNYATDGFSEPYRVALLFSSLFYYLLGLYFLYRVLNNYFSAQLSAMVLLLLSFGTHVFYYLTIAAGMTHVVNFFLVAALIHYTIAWHRQHKLKQTLVIGLLLGFLALIRPINTLFVVIPLLYKSTEGNIISHFKLQFTFWAQYVLMAAIAVSICTPQLLYWKYVTGDYLFNSYVGEQFYFSKPHLLEGLFGFRKGWFVYTPLMVLAVLGFFRIRNYTKSYGLIFTIVIPIYIYSALSWWCWWYGGSFGMRAFIDLYPILALALAAFLQHISTFKKSMRRAFQIVCYAFVALNLFQTMQSKYNILHYDSMTAKAYFMVFGATSHVKSADAYLEKPNYEKALAGEE